MYAERARLGALGSFFPFVPLGAFSAFSAALRCLGVCEKGGDEVQHGKIGGYTTRRSSRKDSIRTVKIGV